jgi:hypothetical protein
MASRYRPIRRLLVLVQRERWRPRELIRLFWLLGPRVFYPQTAIKFAYNGRQFTLNFQFAFLADRHTTLPWLRPDQLLLRTTNLCNCPKGQSGTADLRQHAHAHRRTPIAVGTSLFHAVVHRTVPIKSERVSLRRNPLHG